MYLGIDIGTSSVKAVIMDDHDLPVATASAPLALSLPRPLWCEQAPEDWPPPRPPFRPWYELVTVPPGRTIVFGHWSRNGLVERPGLRGLDTGCVWGGTLTAWIAEEDRRASVSAARQYAAFDG